MDRQINSQTFTTPAGKELTGYYREGTNDKDTLTACITEDPYAIDRLFAPGELQNEHAIDLGAHIGGPTLRLASLECHVHSVEVLPENYDLLLRNVYANEFRSDVVAYPYAIAHADGQRITARYDDITSESGKIHEYMGNTRPAGNVPYRSVEVETISLVTIMHDITECAILKSDCEGAEWDAFKDLPLDLLRRIRFIAMELHDGTPERFEALLKGQFENISGAFDLDYGHCIFKRKK